MSNSNSGLRRYNSCPRTGVNTLKEGDDGYDGYVEKMGMTDSKADFTLAQLYVDASRETRAYLWRRK